ncbi:hypothetical protein [Aphanothece minutissima]|uniref:hypothetical protein n=1 Tax=Aphanothece minutissima TaxID=543815 RepID=UPI0011B26D00|nr:hypothetical protein [Aphanothece minutissima]
MLSRYLVEHPADKVSITGGQELTNHGYRHSVTPEGFLLLEWDRIREDETRLGRGINYVKHGRMERIQGSPALWRYTEQFKIKWLAPSDTFELRLHQPNDRISAVKTMSRAEFVMDSHGRVATQGYRRKGWRTGYPGYAMALTPAQLSGVVFHGSGTLQVNWVLESAQ